MSAPAVPQTATTGLPVTAWSSFRTLLESQREDCLRQREIALAETVASVPDPVAVSRSASLLRTIDEVDEALARIDAGTYGVCVHCGGTIPEERLEFRPSAAACVSCQQTR
jgi:DnaK suppressor protein